MGVELRGLAGKKVLITGAAKGQGFSHAKAFAEAGCDVALLDITHPVDPDIYDVATPDMLAAAAAAIEERGRMAVPLSCDIREESEVAAAVGKALAEFGGVIDVLVNNAGVAALDTVHGMRSNVLHAVLDTNLKGTMFVTKYAVDNMIGRRRGRSSTSRRRSPAAVTPCSATTSPRSTRSTDSPRRGRWSCPSSTST